jgi:hypothetical protein
MKRSVSRCHAPWGDDTGHCHQNDDGLVKPVRLESAAMSV